MKKSNLTPWFPDAVKPVRSGVYEVRMYDYWMGYILTGYARWNCEIGKWGFLRKSVKKAALAGNFTGGQEKEWRGVFKD